MTWERIAQLRDRGMDAVLLSVGATEQPDPHLTPSVDRVTPERMAHAVSAETGKRAEGEEYHRTVSRREIDRDARHF